MPATIYGRLPHSMRTMLFGLGIVALVSTLGDLVWYGVGVEHRVIAGLIHGAVLLAAVGGVLGVASGRPAAGLAAGAASGVGGALLYYALAPVMGQGAMVVAWAGLWVLLALLDRLLLSPDGDRRSTTEVLARGVVAALAGGVAFALLVGVIWGRPGPDGRNYLVTYLAWAAAWAPGMLTLGLRNRRQGSQVTDGTVGPR